MTTKNRTVLFISRAYGEHAGGMERLSFELIQTFENAACAPLSPIGEREGVRATQAKLLWQVITIVYETKPRRSLLSTRLSSIIFVATVLPRALAASKHADVVHIGDPVLSLVGWCIAKFRHIPVVVTVHGLDVSYSNYFYQKYLQIFFQNFSAYIPISEYAKKLLEQKILSKNISVIPPALHDRLYNANISKKNLEKLLNQSITNKTVLATTGRLVKRKGHAWFIEHVMTKLPKNFLYIIAGDGPERARLTELIVMHSLQHKVILLGRISDVDNTVLLNTIDAFIQPNISITGDAEGFGIAPLEAALCARNVFASNIDGIPSAIHAGKNGMLIEAENSQAWITALTEYSKNPSQNLQARTYTKENFNWDTVREKYEEVFGSFPSPYLT